MPNNSDKQPYKGVWQHKRSQRKTIDRTPGHPPMSKAQFRKFMLTGISPERPTRMRRNVKPTEEMTEYKEYLIDLITEGLKTWNTNPALNPRLSTHTPKGTAKRTEIYTTRDPETGETSKFIGSELLSNRFGRWTHQRNRLEKRRISQGKNVTGK